MPVIIGHGRTFLGLLGLDLNSKFHYPKYFSVIPAGGANPKQSFSQPFFAVAAAMTPKPTRLALVGADAEFPKNALDGARVLARESGLKIVYDRSYPPATPDFSPIIRALQATHPDLVFVASYPPDTVGMIRAAHEAGLKAQLFGGGMVGLQSTPIKTQLGPLINGITTTTSGSRSAASQRLRQWRSCSAIGPKHPASASISSALICRPSPTPTCRCWPMPSPPLRGHFGKMAERSVGGVGWSERM